MIKKIVKLLYDYWFRSVSDFVTFSLNDEDIKEALPEPNPNSLNPYKRVIFDENYKSFTVEDLKEVLERDDVSCNFFVKEKFDCDNFAMQLAGSVKRLYPELPFGIVVSLSHAYNLFIDKYGKAWYIEPQTDKIYSEAQIKLKKEYWPLSLILI